MNQFYVDPMADISPGIQGLARSVKQFRDVKRQEQEKQEQKDYQSQAKKALAEAFQSGDPAKVQEVVIQYPETANVAREMFGMTNERTEAIASDTYSRVIADPGNAQQYLDAGIQQVAAAGGNPINMVQDYAMFQVSPDEALKRIQLVAPAFGLGKGEKPRIGQYNPGDYTPESWASFAAGGHVDPSILKRYETSAKERLYTDEGLASRAVEVESDIARGKSGAAETAKLEARKAMQPALEAEIAREVEKVKRESKQLQDFDKKANDAGGVLDLIEIAEPLLDEATESLVGAGLDAAGALFGLSSKGAEAAAKLKTLEGALILKMPRMEGPQSDRDQLLYKQMAAQIGDPTVPSRIRKAALETLKELNQKYQEAPEPVKVKRFQGQDKAAYDWAKSNPDDPRAAQILQRLGVK